MPLSDYVPETADIMYRDKVLCTVRGLNSQDVAVLIRNHVGDLRRMFSMYENAQKLLPNDESDIEAMIYTSIANAPSTIAKLIAIASDEPANLEGARRLSMPLQMKVVIKVLELTLEDVGGPLGLMALFRMLAMTMTPLPTSGSTQSAPPPTIQ